MKTLARPENYGDRVSRLFPVEGVDPSEVMVINGWRTIEITFQVTEACDMRCTYCYQKAKSPKRMSFETAKRAVDMLLASDERTNQYVTSRRAQGVVLAFIGGEPLLEIELIDRICDYFLTQCIELHHPWATRCRFNICSNGLGYFRPEVQEFISKYRGLLDLNITVDGCKELHDTCRLDAEGKGTYDRAIAAVRHYAEHWDGDMGSKMTIAPGNVDMVFPAVKSMIENGYRDIFFNCVYEEGWTAEHARTLYNELKRVTDYVAEKDLFEEVYLSMLEEGTGEPMPEEDDRNWCGGAGLMLCVNPEGKFYPCLRYEESSMGNDREPYVIGDLEHGIMNTPEHKKRVDCLGCITRRSQSSDECWSCPIARGCAWCTAYNYQVTGSPDKRVTYICIMHRARAMACCYFWNTYYRRKGLSQRKAMYIPKDWALEIVSEAEYEVLLELAKEGD